MLWFDRPLVQISDRSRTSGMGVCLLSVCRNVTGSDELIDVAMKSLHDVGFINYYGMQRFGTTRVTTHDIGRFVTVVTVVIKFLNCLPLLL